MADVFKPMYVVCSSTVASSGCEYRSLCVNTGNKSGVSYTTRVDSRTGEECQARRYGTNTCDCWA
jgi:hypothetical protein